MQAMRHTVIVGDLLAVAVTSLVTVSARFLATGYAEYAVPVAYACLLVGAFWIIVMAVMGSYDTRILSAGTEEYRRVLASSMMVMGTVSGVSYVLGLEVTRGLVLLGIPLGVVLLLETRFILRRRLAADRRKGIGLSRTIVVGDASGGTAMAEAFAQDPAAGLEPVGVLAPPRSDTDAWLTELQDLVTDLDAHAVVLTAHPHLTPDVVRAVGWRLEGPGVDLLVTPSFADVGGPRITMRQAAGLPLIHLDEPHLTGPKRIAKRAMDVIGAGTALVVLSPLLLGLAVAVRLTSPGPAFYRHERIGQAGRRFTMWKLRSMVAEADSLPEARDAHHASLGEGKLRRDPRVTGLGRLMRRWSLDELPQLWNVVRNDMSLVGPRPLLVREACHLVPAEERRHLTKPGMTGLWQVSGRADRTWNERMRLDLTYVEQWSLTLDLVILLKTVRAVLARSGAY